MSKIIREVITDPGVGYSVVNSILFASSANAWGLGACLVATGVAVISKILSLQKNSTVPRVFLDGRTPLRVSSLALLLVGGMALFNGDMLPAVTSAFFAAANFRIAESILRAEQKQRDHRKLAKVIFQRPDFYINAGFACAGLMAGGSAFWVFPVVAASLWIATRSVLQGKPEHTGHPKVVSAGAALIFSAIGFTSGNFWPAVSHILSALVLLNIESRVTPGGFRQVLRDVYP